MSPLTSLQYYRFKKVPVTVMVEARWTNEDEASRRHFSLTIRYSFATSVPDQKSAQVVLEGRQTDAAPVSVKP